MAHTFRFACIAAVLVASNTARADGSELKGPVTHPGKYGQAGCGLGAIVFEDQKGYIQIVAATLNALFGTQTFAITSGTSNCENVGDAKASLDQENFTKINYARLSRDAAAGKGETLATFASLLGCNEDARGPFYIAMQSHHADVFARDADAQQVVHNAKAVANHDPALAAGCDRI
jgi:hypothetical protein